MDFDHDAGQSQSTITQLDANILKRISDNPGGSDEGDKIIMRRMARMCTVSTERVSSAAVPGACPELANVPPHGLVLGCPVYQRRNSFWLSVIRVAIGQGRDGVVSAPLSKALIEKLQELKIRRKSILMTRSVTPTDPEHVIQCDTQRVEGVSEALPLQAAASRAALWDLDALVATKEHDVATDDGLNAIAPSNSTFEPSLSILNTARKGSSLPE